jgi:hypothetical protein
MNEATTLCTDRRGAVMLIGIFMAAVLVGILHYLMGVGDAIIARESVQDGADATAFAAAVYHARGMNVISMINLIMASVLGALIAAKVLQVLVVGANVIACFLFQTDVGGTVCQATARLEPGLEESISHVSEVVTRVLKGLNTASRGVAKGMPRVAEARSTTVLPDYQPAMQLGFAASVSMVSPTPGEMDVSDRAGAPALTGRERLGLPVILDSFPMLCQAARKSVSDGSVLSLPTAGISAGDLASFAGPLLGDALAAVPAYYCVGAEDQAVAHFTKTICAEADKQVDAANAADPPVSSGSSGAHRNRYTAKNCGARVSDGLRAGNLSRPPGTSGANGTGGGGYSPVAIKAGGDGGQAEGDANRALKGGADEAPMKVYPPATFGSDYYAVWSFAYASRLASSSQSNSPGWFFAEAEFYYDIADGGFSFGDGQSQAFPEDAMWNMRWRARLRRLRAPAPAIDSIIAPVIGEHAKGANRLAAGALPAHMRDIDDMTNVVH